MTSSYYRQFTRPSPSLKGNLGDWHGRHMTAITAPVGHERPIVNLIKAWTDYADQHAHRFESGIGKDYVLGAEWEVIGSALLGLLNGELGRLDGGTLDGFIRNTLKAEGFDPDTM
jgi:hypothetical protein